VGHGVLETDKSAKSREGLAEAGGWPGLAAKAVVVIQKLSCVATRCSTLHPLPDCVWPDASFLRCGRPSVGLCGWLPKEEERLPILVAEETPFPAAFSLPATRARSHARTHLSSILPVVLECKIFKDANHGKPLRLQNLMAHRHET